MWSAWKCSYAARTCITWPNSRSHWTSPEHTLWLVPKGIKSGDFLSAMTLYPLLKEPETVSIEGKDQLLSTRAADVQFGPFSISQCLHFLLHPPTHRALFSTPVNDKTMLPCYLTAAADGDYGPVEAWCLSRAGRGLPAPWSHASTPGVNSGVKHPERLEKVSSSMRSLGARSCFSSSVHSQ